MSCSSHHFKLAWLGACLACGGTLFGVSPVSKTTAAALRAAKQSEEIENRIDALLKLRLKPEPLPRVPANPFVIVSGLVTAQHADAVAPEPAADANRRNPLDTSSGAQAEEFPAFTSAELLARCVGTLKFGGVIQLNDRLQIVINNVPRKEGDVILVTHGKTQAYLRVVRIAPGAVTFRLNEAEQVVRY
ncbi:MAG: hypothetical protein JWM35_117 [Verrucomicrobia bacterium]|nr:hypothetical protein [Verrucomicrobiota bacterium]